MVAFKSYFLIDERLEVDKMTHYFMLFPFWSEQITSNGTIKSSEIPGSLCKSECLTDASKPRVGIALLTVRRRLCPVTQSFTRLYLNK